MMNAPGSRVCYVCILNALLALPSGAADDSSKSPGTKAADTPKATAQRVMDLVKENKIDDALTLILPITRPVGPEEDREHLQQMSDAFAKGVKAELLEEHVRPTAAAVVVVFTRPGRDRGVDPDPFLLVKREEKWRLLTDDPEQYQLSDAEREDLRQAQGWFKERKKALRNR